MFNQNPIPENAKKAYQWHSINIREREQQLFDWSYAPFQTIQRKEFAQILPVTQDNKLIIVHEEQPRIGEFYGLIGWSIELWDTPEQTINKEAREETGMQIHTLKDLYTSPIWGSIGTAYGYITHDFSFPYETAQEPWEKITMIQVDFEQFLTMIVSDKRRSTEFTYRVMKNYLINNNKEWLYKLLFNKDQLLGQQ